MKVTYNDHLHIIHWKHERSGRVSSRGEAVVDNMGGSTLCTIQEGPKERCQMISFGRATCSNKETYCKATGRKVSLTYALRGCANKEFRKAVWDQYRKECR